MYIAAVPGGGQPWIHATLHKTGGDQTSVYGVSRRSAVKSKKTLFGLT
jgi:hypothetical protein